MAEPQAEPQKVIAVVGMPGSGKGTFSEEAAKDGWTVIAFGDITREVARRELGQITDPFAVHRLVDGKRKTIGQDWIAKEAVAEAKSSGTGLICLDGARTPEEITYVKKEYPGAKLIGILADDATRHARLLARSRVDDSGATLEQIREKDKSGGAWGIPELISMADIRIENNGTIEEFRGKSRKVLASL